MPPPLNNVFPVIEHSESSYMKPYGEDVPDDPSIPQMHDAVVTRGVSLGNPVNWRHNQVGVAIFLRHGRPSEVF